MAETLSSLKNIDKEKWVENFARFGIISKGIVYCIMGLLTLLAAFGLSRDKGTKTEALNLVYEQPFGRILLFIVALGLFGYVTWRFFQAVRDIDHKGTNTKAIIVRIGYGISALLYLGLTALAVRLSINGPSVGDGDSRRFIISKVLEYPAGNYAIGIGALIIVGTGVKQIYKGLTKKFMKNVQLIASDYQGLFKTAGMIGCLSRGIVLTIIGYFLIRAAVSSNANEAQGTNGAFNFLQHTFGNALMGVVAIGLFLYGIFMFVKARYQSIDLHF